MRQMTWAVAILVFCLPLGAQKRTLPRNATIYLEEIDNDLDGYLRAEFFKKNIPLRVVLSLEEADLVLKGTSTAEEKRKWHEGWLTYERDKTSANVMVVEKASGVILWANEAGDRDIWWGSMARGGHRKVASRLANKLKKAIQKR